MIDKHIRKLDAGKIHFVLKILLRIFIVWLCYRVVQSHDFCPTSVPRFGSIWGGPEGEGDECARWIQFDRRRNYKQEGEAEDKRRRFKETKGNQERLALFIASAGKLGLLPFDTTGGITSHGMIGGSIMWFLFWSILYIKFDSETEGGRGQGGSKAKQEGKDRRHSSWITLQRFPQRSSSVISRSIRYARHFPVKLTRLIPKRQRNAWAEWRCYDRLISHAETAWPFSFVSFPPLLLSFLSRCFGHAGRSKRTHVLSVPPSILRRDDRVRQPRVLYRVVPFWLCRSHHETERQMVLPQVRSWKKKEVISRHRLHTNELMSLVIVGSLYRLLFCTRGS